MKYPENMLLQSCRELCDVCVHTGFIDESEIKQEMRFLKRCIKKFSFSIDELMVAILIVTPLKSISLKGTRKSEKKMG